MSQKIIDNWLSLAEYDLATAYDMSKAKRYLYVAFMCQQAIEKILKACYVKQHTSTPPYTHNLLRLIKELSFKDEMGDEMMAAAEELNSYYIESRYTEDIEELVSGIESELYHRGSREVTSREIGEMVMQNLRRMDEVAYIRFATIYRRFADVEDLADEIESLLERRQREAILKAQMRLNI